MFINDIAHAGELKWVSIYQTNKALYHNSLRSANLFIHILRKINMAFLPRQLTSYFGGI